MQSTLTIIILVANTVGEAPFVQKGLFDGTIPKSDSVLGSCNGHILACLL